MGKRNSERSRDADEFDTRDSKDKPIIGKRMAEKSGGLFSADDWMCKS